MHFDSIDTNLILRIILNDVPSQRQKVSRLLATPNTMHYVSDLAISEVVHVLEYSVEQSREEIGNELLFFLTHYSNCLVYNKQLFSVVFPLYLTHPKLSFIDCYLASKAELDNAEPLFTFDKKLASQHPSAKVL